MFADGYCSKAIRQTALLQYAFALFGLYLIASSYIFSASGNFFSLNN